MEYRYQSSLTRYFSNYRSRIFFQCFFKKKVLFIASDPKDTVLIIESDRVKRSQTQSTNLKFSSNLVRQSGLGIIYLLFRMRES